MLEWLVRITLMTLKRQYLDSQLEDATFPTINDRLTQFRQLLEQHYRQQWTVKQYASELHVSVSTLNRLCNHSVGKTTKAIILDRLLSEARRRLIYTREPLDQIAYTLGFKDPAYFSRLFKKLNGTPPSYFRQAENFGAD